MMIIIVGHHMCSSNASHLHVFIDQQEIIGRTENNKTNSDQSLDQEKNYYWHYQSPVSCFVSGFLFYLL